MPKQLDWNFVCVCLKKKKKKSTVRRFFKKYISLGSIEALDPKIIDEIKSDKFEKNI